MASSTELQIRPAQRVDVPDIAAIHVRSWQAAYRGLIPDQHLDSLSVDKRQAIWREAIEYADPQVHVASQGREIVGFVAFDRSRDKGTPATTGEIWSLYVAPTHWRRGVGAALWKAAHQGLLEEGCTDITLWVLAGNERALAFYERVGFQREPAAQRNITVGGAELPELRLKRAIA